MDGARTFTRYRSAINDHKGGGAMRPTPWEDCFDLVIDPTGNPFDGNPTDERQRKPARCAHAPDRMRKTPRTVR